MSRRFWIAHGALPAAAFLLLMVVVEAGRLDRRVADLFFDVEARIWPLDHAWWSYTLLHETGKAALIILWIGLAAVALASRWRPGLRPWRAPVVFVCTLMVLAPAAVGLIKEYSDVPCPSATVPYGGRQPYVRIFDLDRPALERGGCFPGAHSSSGFALVAGYFALRDRRRRLAVRLLIAGMALGLAFAFGQWARGAHFVSHDLWSFAITWVLALGAYAAWRRLLLPQSSSSTPRDFCLDRAVHGPL